MKKFLKRNFIISIFGFISVLITASYAITYNMPDYFRIESWYSLFNNISISYIAALIFYVLQVYKPECEKSRKAQAALTPLFLDLIQFIEIAIDCCRKYVSIDEAGKIKIDWWDKEKKVMYFIPVIDNSNNCGHRPAIRKSVEDLRETDNIYKSKIKEMKDRIDFRECDPDILNALSKLEAADFFKSIVNVILMFEGTFITFPDFQKQVDKFETLKNEFKRCCGITCEYRVRNAENIEIAASDAIFYKKALQATSVDEFNEIAYREYLKLQLKSLIPDEMQLNELIDCILAEVMKKCK